MIRQPDFISPGMLDEVRPDVRERSGSAVDEVVLETFNEGLSAQIMHVGPYREEGPTVELLHGYIREQGYRELGHHHEIHLGDPRRTKPEKLKTILRHPVEKN